MAIPFPSPWRQRLFSALATVEHTLLLVSPFIKESVITQIEQVLTARHPDNSLSIRVLCRIRLDDLLSGASDLAAFERIVAWPGVYPGWKVELRALDNVHAKVWVCDTQVALIGSGNATAPGLDRNVEYEVELHDSSVIEQILDDWSKPWVHATPVASQDLMPYRELIDRVSEDPQLREAQAVLKRRQAELAKGVNVLPHLGTDFTLQSFVGASATLPSSNGPSPTQQSRLARQASTMAANSSLDRSADLQVRLDHLWYALRLIFSMEHTATGYKVQPDPSNALKITCEPQDEIHNFGNADEPIQLSRLRLIWADGFREVTAALSAFVRPGTDKTSIRDSWAISLNAQAIQHLVRVLNKYETFQLDGFGSTSSYKEVRFHLDPSRSHLRIGGWQITPLDNGREDDLALGDSTNIDVVPAPIDAGLAPIADPIAEARLSHDDLWTALWDLDHPTTDTHVDVIGMQEPVIEVRIYTDQPPRFVVDSVHRWQGRGKRVPLTDPRFTGPPVTLRLDRAALNQMLLNAGWITVRIGKDADVIQFESESPLSSAQNSWSVHWFYQLRSLE